MPNLPKITVKDIKTYLDGILKTSSSSTYDRKLSSLKKFFTWAQKQGYFQENAVEDYLNQKESQIISKVVKAEKENSQTTKPGLPFYSSVQARLISKFEGKSRIQNFLYKAFYSRPEWYKTYHSVLFTRYFHFAILTIFSVGLVLGTYDQFRQKATPASAFPTSLVRPKRYLSFQGRLTNQYGNPVTGATNIIFKLWDHSTNSTEVACDGGVDENCLWSTSTCSVDPDADGIFNVLLGTTSGADFTCSTATEITSDVFSENAEVWLGVKVDTDAEATPRIQIATVAYALNAETLQGYPIDATGSATKNSVVTMNDGGEIIIAESGPTMKSVSGTFSIQGKALSISTPDTSNGSVTINPDGTGTLDLTFEGAAAGGGAGGFVNAINASITSGALYFGQVASAATGYDFIQFKSGSSPTEKFAIDDAGNITTAGDMAVNGGDITSSGALNLTPGGALTVGATGQNLTLQGAITALTSTGAGNDITLTSIDDIVFNDAQLSSAINLTDTDTVFSSGDTAIVDAINTAYGAAIGGVGSVWTLDTGKVYPTTISNNVGIGTTTAANIISKLFLTNDSTLTGKALAIFNQTESQDILTASASGTTVANLDISGNLAIEGSISDLSGTVLTIDDDLKVTGNDIQDSGGNVIISSDGSGKIDSLANIATTLTMDVANEINFRDAALKIYSSADGQLDIDADTLVQITSPTTQIVSSTALDLDSPLLNLATQATDIELKDDTGSALTISEGSNNYFLVTTTDDNEIVTLDLPAGGGTSLTGNLFISNIAKTINLGTGTAIDTINIGTETTSADIVNIGSVNAGNVTLVTAAILDVDAATVNIDGSTAINIGTTADKPIDIDATTFDLDASGALTLTGASNSVIDFPNFDVATTGNITTAGDLAVNGGDITSTATTFNFDIGDTGTLNFRDGTNTLVAISDQGTTGRLAVSDSLQVGSTSTLAYSRFGTATTGHAGNLTAADDLLISSDMELDGILYLDGGNIANSAGNSTIVFTGSPTTGQNALSASSWLIENTTNVGLAALTVNQTKAGDIFTASASGTPKFVITNAGNVGIGTTAPGAKLDVRGSAIFNEDGTDSDFRIEGNEDYNLFFVDASADKIGIGIGATAPDALLTVGRSLPGAYIGKFQNSDTSGDVLKLIGAGTSNSRFILNLQNSAGAGTAMVVTQAGNVGIGITGPFSNLDIRFPYVKTDTTQRYALQLGSNEATNYSALSISSVGGASQAVRRWDIQTDERGIANSGYLNLQPLGGNVGIGTTGPGGMLDIVKTHSSGTTQEMFRTAFDANWGLRLVQNYAGAGDIKYELKEKYSGIEYDVLAFKAGNVGIGTTGPEAKLDVVGTVDISDANKNLGTNLLEIYKTGAMAQYESLIGVTQRDAGTTDRYFFVASRSDSSDVWVDNEFLLRTNGVGLSDGGWTTPADFAEYFYTANTDLESGDLVTITEHEYLDKDHIAMGVIKGADKSDIPLGVISTRPGFVGALSDDVTNAVEIYENDPHYKIVGLLGQVPFKVTTINGSIQSNDLISTSVLPKYGAKATETGIIVGKATESTEDWNEQNCPVVQSLNSIQWPEDNGTNPAKPCFRLPDGTYIGKIMVFVNVSWHDPDVYLTDTGDLNIIADNLENSSTTYSLVNTAGEIINRIGAFTEVITANIKTGALEVQGTIKAGAVETKDFTTDTFLAFQATVDNLLIKSGLVVPNIKTNIISPIADTDLIINLENTATDSVVPTYGNLIVQGEEGKKVASIDSSGNATFSGTLESDKVKTNDLIAGKIYADEIIARSGSFTEIYSASQSAITREEIEEILRDAENNLADLSSNYDQSLIFATNSANLEELVLENLFVTDIAAVTSLSVTNSLTLGSDLVIQTSSLDNGQILASTIDTLSAPLQIQSLAMAPLEIMAGKFRIETNGNVFIDGNLFVAGQIESQGLTLKPNQEVIENGFGDLLKVQGINGDIIASIDASGSARFNEVSTNKVIIAGSEENQEIGIISGDIQTNATAGKAIIPAGVNQIIITNSNVTNYTLTYVTPTSSTKNNVLYVKAKDNGYFVVGFNQALDVDVSFNWWVIDVVNPPTKTVLQ